MVVRITANGTNSQKIDMAGDEYPTMDAAVDAVTGEGYEIIEAGSGYYIYPSGTTEEEMVKDYAGYDAIGEIEE